MMAAWLLQTITHVQEVFNIISFMEGNWSYGMKSQEHCTSCTNALWVSHQT